ncbi:MAG TPA: hypothetical protein V6C58_00300 [Allocoleopsis sp.]
MKQLQLLDIKQNNNNQSPEEYKQNVIEAVELLVTLGIMETPSTDLKTSIEFVIDKMRQNEKILYGKELTKEDLMEQMQQINSELFQLHHEIADIDSQIILEETKIKAKNSFKFDN